MCKVILQISLASNLSIRLCSNLSLSRSGRQKGEHSVLTGVLFFSLYLRRTPVHKYMQHDGPTLMHGIPMRLVLT